MATVQKVNQVSYQMGIYIPMRPSKLSEVEQNHIAFETVKGFLSKGTERNFHMLEVSNRVEQEGEVFVYFSVHFETLAPVDAGVLGEVEAHFNRTYFNQFPSDYATQLFARLLNGEPMTGKRCLPE